MALHFIKAVKSLNIQELQIVLLWSHSEERVIPALCLVKQRERDVLLLSLKPKK